MSTEMANKKTAGHFAKWKVTANELTKYWHVLRKYPLTIVGLVIVTAFVVVGMFAPLVIPYPQDIGGTVHLARSLQPPSLEHPFGTDDMGRDVLSRVLYGSRLSLSAGMAVVLLSSIVGIPLGAIAGYYGGKVERTIMGISDMFMGTPHLVLAVAIAAVLGPSQSNAAIALSIPWWPSYARVIRGHVLVLRGLGFVEAVKSMGASGWYIILHHILPNCVQLIITQSTLQMGSAILGIASLAFIGMGAQPPAPEWGLMVSTGRAFMTSSWWYVTFPGLAIFIAVLAFNMIGDGLRDIFDLRLR